MPGVIKEEDYDDDYSSEEETDDDEIGRRRQQVVHLSQMGSDGAVPQGQPILLQMEFLQQDGEGGGEGEDGQVVRKVTRQATLQTTPDGQQIIILQVGCFMILSAFMHNFSVILITIRTTSLVGCK